MNINKEKLDAIAELANIASGNAVTALSQMTSTKIDMNVPCVEYVDLMDVASYIDDIESLKYSVYVSTSGDIEGFLVFISDFDSTKGLAKLVAGGMDIDYQSVMLEVVNIINGSYLRALSDMLGITVDVTPPEVAYDMLGSIINSFVAQLSIESTKSIMLSSNLHIDDTVYKAYQLLLMEEKSLLALLKLLEEKFNL